MKCLLSSFSPGYIKRFSLRQKALFIAFASMFILILFAGTGIDIVTRSCFDRLENNWINENASRVKQLIDNEAENLIHTARDYSFWDETYNFIKSPNSSYVKTNLSIDFFKNFKLYGVFIYSNDLKRAAGLTLSTDGIKIVSADTGWDSALSSCQLNKISDYKSPSGGLIEFRKDLFVVSCSPILRSDGSGPVRGSIILVRKIDRSFLNRIADIAEVAVDVSDQDGYTDTAKFAEPVPGLLIFTEKSNKTIHVYLLLKSIKQKQIGVLRILLQRDIQIESMHARYLFFAVLIVVLAASGLLIHFMLNRLVVSRLEKMCSDVREIGDTLDLSRRLDIKQGDEIDDLSRQINRMLDSLELANKNRDIALHEKERLQEYMVHAKKMDAMGTLAGGIAHDFNNMLVVILGSAELMHFKLPEGHPVLEHVEMIEKAGEKASTLVRQMLALNKGYIPQKAYFSVSQALNKMLDMVKITLPAYIRSSLENNVPGDDFIYADITQFEQVVLNLVTNSAHAMAGKVNGELKILVYEDIIYEGDPRFESRFLKEGRYIKIEVADSGGGISPEIRDRIFDPFFTTKPAGSGTGLGLSVVHSFVIHNGGHISVESEPGQGTKFVIYLPAVEEKRKKVYSYDGKDVRILVVDDDHLVRKTIISNLERLGYLIYDAANSHSAMKILREFGDDINLVITDQIMPGMSGLELCRNILSVRPGLPVMLISAYASSLDETDEERHGFSKILMKPVSIDVLNDAIMEILSGKKSE